MASSKVALSKVASSKILGVALAASAILAFAAPAGARSNFDGAWSVVIMTQTGDCDRAYRYPVTISSGTLQNAGDVAVEILGKVKDNGVVTVRVTSGQNTASGSGRLSQSSGSGSWSGGQCAGVWTAERRG